MTRCKIILRLESFDEGLSCPGHLLLASDAHNLGHPPRVVVDDERVVESEHGVGLLRRLMLRAKSQSFQLMAQLVRERGDTRARGGQASGRRMRHTVSCEALVKHVEGVADN